LQDITLSPVSFALIVSVGFSGMLVVIGMVRLPSLDLAITWCVDIPVPVIPNEIDRSSACIVGTAIPSPLLGLHEWYAQVDGLRIGFSPDGALDDYRLRIVNLWRRIIIVIISIVAEIDSSVVTWLTDLNGYADLGVNWRSRQDTSQRCHPRKEGFHDDDPVGAGISQDNTCNSDHESILEES
jgi:hypothetical protein